MRYIIGLGLAFAPLAALANPGHSAPILHTHPQEVIGWMVVGITTSYALFKLAIKKR